jgi:glycosyltransferase involved in cell wall biosynthesis
MSKISDYKVGFNCADFRLMSRKVINNFKSLREKTRFIRGLVSWMGYKKIGITFKAQPRKSGKSKFSFRKMIGFALDGLLSFSTFPIRIISGIGILVSFFAFLYIIRMIYFVVFEKQGIPEYLPVMALILFLTGIQMIMTGILGEYIAKIFTETKNRPLYLIDEIYDNSIKEEGKKDKA